MMVPNPAPRYVRDASPEGIAFRFVDGSMARSLAQLVTALQHASVETAWYHREHLAPWLREVLHDEPLARRVEHFARAGLAPDVFRETVLALARSRLDELTRVAL